MKHLKRAKRQLEIGKPISKIKDSIKKHLEGLHHTTWLESKKSEYDTLYPVDREMTDSEKLLYAEGNQLQEVDKQTIDYPRITIYYSDDENYVTFNEWIKEERIIEKAIEEITEPSQDGTFEIIVQAYIPEVKEPVRPYERATITDEEITSYMIEISDIKTVTMRQCRLALLKKGLLSTVENAIQSGNDEALKIEWEYSLDIKRDWQSLIDLATSLGITSSDLDNLFFEASLL